jgi:hypothetical protein
MIKRKRMTLALLAAALVAAAALGATLAALGATTDQQENMFTPSENISAKLSEPNWDPDEGIRLVPGKRVPKDPMITNTSRVDEYVAIRLVFLDSDGTPMDDTTLNELLRWLEIDWNTGAGPGKWTLFEGENVPSAPPAPPAATQPMAFYYNDALAPGQASEALFDSVRVKNEFDDPGLTEADLRFLEGLGRFSVTIEGAAVQTAGFADAAAASETLYALFP